VRLAGTVTAFAVHGLSGAGRLDASVWRLMEFEKFWPMTRPARLRTDEAFVGGLWCEFDDDRWLAQGGLRRRLRSGERHRDDDEAECGSSNS